MKYIKIILLIFIFLVLLSCKNKSVEILLNYESEVTNLLNDEQYEDALLLCDKMERINPEFLSIYLCRGVILSEMGQYESAELEFTKTLEKNKHLDFFLPRQLVSAYAWRSMARMKQNKFELAKADAKKCITIYDDDRKGYISLATIYYENKEYENALQLHDTMLSKFPNWYTTYYLRAIVHYSLQNYKLSIDDCNFIINNGQDNTLHTFYIRGLSYIGMRNYEKAILDLNKVQEKFPEKNWISYSIAYTYYKLGDIEKAKQNYIIASKNSVEANSKVFPDEIISVTNEFTEKIETKEVFKEILKMLEKVSD